jgi:hypothetical protein
MDFFARIFGGNPPAARSAGFQTCCVADFQVGRTHNIQQHAGVENRDKADLEVCATLVNNSHWNFRRGVLWIELRDEQFASKYRLRDPCAGAWIALRSRFPLAESAHLI